MSNIFREGNYQSRGWGEIALDFFDIVKDRINASIRLRQIKMAKIISSIILLAIGLIFFLNGLAILIGKLINDSGWSGYIVVGIVLMIIGMFAFKK